ncbi:MAG TPA: M28 family peptidase [Planctomycetota bacterium]
MLRLLAFFLPPAVLALAWWMEAPSREEAPLPAAVRADGERLLADVAALVDTVGPRPSGTPEAAAATRWTADRLTREGILHNVVTGDHGEAYDFWARFQIDAGTSLEREAPLRNVVAEFPQVGPAELPGRILVFAHTDSVALAPGAEDNASGVALALSLCELLRDEAPRRRVTVVFTDGEERNLLGAALFASRMTEAEVDKVQLAFAVEMSGWGSAPYLHWFLSSSTLLDGPQPPPPDRVLATLLSGSARAGAPYRVADPFVGWLFPALRDHIAIRNDADHRVFELLGRPALMTTTSSLVKFYPWYHRAEDTPDRLSAATLERSATALRGAIFAVGQTGDLTGAPEASHGYPFQGRLIKAMWLRFAMALLAFGMFLHGTWPSRFAALPMAVLTLAPDLSLLAMGIGLPTAWLALAAGSVPWRLPRIPLAVAAMIPTTVAVGSWLFARFQFGQSTRLLMDLRGDVSQPALLLALLLCFAVAWRGPRPAA